MIERTMIYLVTPCFFDSKSLARLIDEVVDQFPEGDRDHLRFVAIDDSAGSDRDRIRGLGGPDVTWIETPFNVGHQRAIVFGLRELAPMLEDDDIIVTLDSDGEDQPADVPRLLDPLESPHDPARLAIALRTRRRETVPFKIAYRLFRVFFHTLTGEVVRSGNFAAMRASLIKRIIWHPYFDISYSATLISLPLAPTLVPCQRGSRYGGKSSMSPARLISHGLGMLVPFSDRIATRAFIGLAMAGFVSLTAIALMALFGLVSNDALPAWPFAVGGAMFLLSLIGLGFVAVIFVVFSQVRALSFSNPRIMHEYDRVLEAPRDRNRQ